MDGIRPQCAVLLRCVDGVNGRVIVCEACKMSSLPLRSTWAVEAMRR
jgi:hypothetical protein